MAKYCMFCGEEIPEAAQFCPSCGQKQTATGSKSSTPKQNDNNSNLGDDDDEMDLLLKFGMMGGNNIRKKPASIKKTEPVQQKVITLDYKPEEISEEIPEEINIKEELPEDILDIASKEVVEEIKEEPEVLTTEPITESESVIKETEEATEEIPSPMELESATEEESSEDKAENEIDQDSEDEFAPVDDDFDVVEDDSSDVNVQEEIIKRYVEENPEESKEEEEAKPVNRHSAKRRDVTIKRRSVSVDDSEEDEETFSTNMRDSSLNSMIRGGEMLADEKADYEKRKNAKIEPDEDETSEEPEQLEGRRQSVQRAERKRQSKRKYDERKFYKIEQDTSDLDENEDPAYDGYYENVLTIDHDQERKKNIDVKSLGLVAILVIVAIGLVYFALNML